MKNLRYIIYVLSLLFAVGCSTEFETPTVGAIQGRISLQIDSQALVASRAVTSNDIEAAMSHIDVLFYDESEQLFHHERVSATEAYQGAVYLTKKREDFAVNALYNVFLVANSTLPATRFAQCSDMDALFHLSQQDELIHMTGQQEVSEAPQYFLMDGQAYDASLGSEPEVKSAVEINNGVVTDDTKLSCVLRRAAAKVVVTLNRGEQVEFINGPQAGYYFRNIPYNTLVVDRYTHDAELITPKRSVSSQFCYWEPDNSRITVVGYMYSHNHKGQSFFERGTSLIINIPLSYTTVNPESGEQTKHSFENSYYQLQLSKEEVFERNHIYYVSATINAPGAEEVSTPITILPTKYSVKDWLSESIDVGGEAGPRYLKVNREQFEMRNVAVDNTSLVFASSHPVTIAINNVYYVDKFGQTKTITSSTAQYNISATPLAELAGNIEVTSDVPTNNTIRYIEMRVYQDDNSNGLHDTGELYEDVLVLQYPLIYVTNIVGWYSYRDDFKTTDSKPTTFKYRGDNITRVGLDVDNIGTNRNPIYVWTGDYVYNNSSAYFWRSKVADDPATTGSNAGKSYLSYYSWGNSSSATEATKSSYGYQNCRMYHVRVTATSADYVVGRPRITDNVTDPGADNAKLVSPSFMIASRLGFVTTGTNIGAVVDDNTQRHTVFADHCREYVEVCKDSNGNPIVYDDWRLPTSAELNIIMDLQGSASDNADAIDYLLNAVFYESASGRTFNTKNDDDITDVNNYSGSSYSVRCVRDAY